MKPIDQCGLKPARDRVGSHAQLGQGSLVDPNDHDISPRGGVAANVKPGVDRLELKRV